MENNTAVTVINASGLRKKHSYFWATNITASFDKHQLDPASCIDHFFITNPARPLYFYQECRIITYLFEDSPGGFVRIINQKEKYVLQPGGLTVDTAAKATAASEYPHDPKLAVHGIKIYLGFPEKFPAEKHKTFAARGPSLPKYSIKGMSLKVLAGNPKFAESEILLTADLAVLEIKLQGRMELVLAVPPTNSTMIYLVSDGHCHNGKSKLRDNDLLISQSRSHLCVSSENNVHFILISAARTDNGS